MHQLPTELSHPCYHDDEAARIQLEAIRWPNGPFCPNFAGVWRPDRDRPGFWARIRQRFSRRQAKIAEACGDASGLVVPRADFDRVRECIANPPPPTPAILEAAERLRNRPVPNR